MTSMMCAYFLKFRFNLERRAKCSPDGGSSLPFFFSQRSGSVDPKRITFQNAQRIVSEIRGYTSLEYLPVKSNNAPLVPSHQRNRRFTANRMGWNLDPSGGRDPP